MECHPDCGACYTTPSTFGPILGMSGGKPANTPYVQLDGSLRCKIFASPLRPKVYGGLQPSAEVYGRTAHQVMIYLIELEALTTL